MWDLVPWPEIEPAPLALSVQIFNHRITREVPPFFMVPNYNMNIGEGNGNPLLYSCLENPIDGEAWWAPVHGVTKSQTRLSD